MSLVILLFAVAVAQSTHGNRILVVNGHSGHDLSQKIIGHSLPATLGSGEINDDPSCH